MAEHSSDSRSLNDLEGFRSTFIELAEESRRELFIFSESLAHPLYHHRAVAEALSAFARSSRFAVVRILVRDTEPMLRRFHRLRELTQRLSSRIELRRIQATVDTPDWEFAIADGRRVLFCDDRQQWRGVYRPDDPARAAKLGDTFRQDWSLATADPNLRRLQL
ncbi:hypothetical protein [Microbulbifer halophilus]|uniref:DUF7931 domain-containing protein n=1 Tax=Microbulbifer halophilus TaxID=453963 RepID=A0ABW5ECF2_9GAMM